MIPLTRRLFAPDATATLAKRWRLLASDPAARPFAGGTDLMVLLEAGHCRPGATSASGVCRELRGIEERRRLVAIGALTTYTEIRQVVRAAGRVSDARSRGRAKPAASRRRIAARSAATSPTRRRPPTRRRRCSSTTRSWSCCRPRGARASPYATFHTGYKKMDLRPARSSRAVSLARASTGLARVLPQGRHPPRAGDLEGLHRRIDRDGPVGRRATCASRWAASRRRAQVCAGRSRAARTAARRSSRSRTRRRRSRADIAPIDDIRSTARYRLRVAQNLLARIPAGSRPIVARVARVRLACTPALSDFCTSAGLSAVDDVLQHELPQGRVDVARARTRCALAEAVVSVLNDTR